MCGSNRAQHPRLCFSKRAQHPRLSFSNRGQHPRLSVGTCTQHLQGRDISASLTTGPMQVYGDKIGHDQAGIFYGGNGKLLACQLLAMLVVPAWVVANTALLFFTLKRFGKLRVSTEEEVMGLDKVCCHPLLRQQKHQILGRFFSCVYWRWSTDVVPYASTLGWVNSPMSWCFCGPAGVNLCLSPRCGGML
jgi:hypothetical protein